MKRFTILALACTTLFAGCSTLKSLLTDDDIAGGLKEALIQGITKGNTNAKAGLLFNKNNILTAVLPDNAVKVLNTLETLGLGGDVTRFTTTLTNAATAAATKSVPVFISGITHIGIKDAVGILGGGYNAATNYLRTAIGDSLRNAIKPEVAAAMNEYKLQEALNDLANKLPVGKQKLNIDFNGLIAKLVANQMFKEVEAEEYRIRTDVNARTSDLLKRVFSSSKAFRQ